VRNCITLALLILAPTVISAAPSQSPASPPDQRSASSPSPASSRTNKESTADDTPALVRLYRSGESLLLVLDQLKDGTASRDAIRRFEGAYNAYVQVQTRRRELWTHRQGLTPALEEALARAFDLQDEWANREIAPMYFRFRKNKPNEAPLRGGPSVGGIPMWDLFRGSDLPSPANLQESRLRLQALHLHYDPVRRNIEALYRERARREAQGLSEPPASK
jgi:hypothetical protein